MSSNQNNSNEELNAVPASEQNELPANTTQPSVENEHALFLAECPQPENLASRCLTSLPCALRGLGVHFEKSPSPWITHKSIVRLG